MLPSPTAQTHLYGKPSFLSTEGYGLVLLGLSALLYSLMSCCVKLATMTVLDSNEIVFLRAMFQTLFVVTAMVWYEEDVDDVPLKEVGSSSSSSCADHNKHDEEQITTTSSAIQNPTPSGTKKLILNPFGRTPTVQWVVIARGALGGLSFVFYYATIGALPLGDAIALLSTRTIVTVLTAAVVFAEPLHLAHILAAVLSVMGSICIARPAFLAAENKEEENHAYHLYGYITAFLGVLTGAGVFLLIRKAGKVGAHTLTLLFSWGFFAILFSSVIGLTEREWTCPTSWKTWLYLSGVCIFGSTAHFLLNFAGRIAPAGLASIMRGSDMLWAYLWQVMILHDVPTVYTITGVVCIVLSLILIAIQKLSDNAMAEIEKKECECAEEMVPVHDRILYGSTHNTNDNTCRESEPLVSR